MCPRFEYSWQRIPCKGSAERMECGQSTYTIVLNMITQTFDFEVRYTMLFCSPTVLCSVTVFDPTLVHPCCVC
jgi:hypothetical protein